jgi:Mg2+ and Co2+ transporter CorA
MSKLSASVNEMKEALDGVLDSQLADAWCCRDSTQFEEILQTTYIKVNIAIRRLQLIKEYIESRQMMARLVLDAKRNQLFSIDLMISTLSMGFGYAGMVAGIWGMNLYNTVYQESKGVFLWVMVSLLVGAIGLPIWVRLFMKSRHLTYLPTDSATSM